MRPFGTYTYADVSLLADRMALGLKSLGVEAGDRVALWMSNRIEWVVAQFAVTRLGAVLVSTQRRHAHMLQEPSVALITQHRAESFDYIDIVRKVLAEDVCPNLQHIVVAAPEEALENPFVTWADVDAKGASSGGRP